MCGGRFRFTFRTVVCSLVQHNAELQRNTHAKVLTMGMQILFHDIYSNVVTATYTFRLYFTRLQTPTQPRRA